MVKDFMIQSAASLGTGLIVGFIFAWIRLPIPAPPAIPAVLGIMGITLGYLLFKYIFN